jgi:hypothetical protein|tara:strand:- start:5716 stop:5961 length:246 start_codon:yes stop_codon:yes gene_type:complete
MADSPFGYIIIGVLLIVFSKKITQININLWKRMLKSSWGKNYNKQIKSMEKVFAWKLKIFPWILSAIGILIIIVHGLRLFN